MLRLPATCPGKMWKGGSLNVELELLEDESSLEGE